MPDIKLAASTAARQAEAARLLALARDLLGDEREQLVRDYIGHALEALARVGWS